MDKIVEKIQELENQLKGEFFEDLYTQEAINYWKRKLNNKEYAQTRNSKTAS